MVLENGKHPQEVGSLSLSLSFFGSVSVDQTTFLPPTLNIPAAEGLCLLSCGHGYPRNPITRESRVSWDHDGRCPCSQQTSIRTLQTREWRRQRFLCEKMMGMCHVQLM